MRRREEWDLVRNVPLSLAGFSDGRSRRDRPGIDDPHVVEKEDRRAAVAAAELEPDVARGCIVGGHVDGEVDLMPRAVRGDLADEKHVVSLRPLMAPLRELSEAGVQLAGAADPLRAQLHREPEAPHLVR